MNIITNRKQLELLIKIAQDNPNFPSDKVVDVWISQLVEGEQKNENKTIPLST